MQNTNYSLDQIIAQRDALNVIIDGHVQLNTARTGFVTLPGVPRSRTTRQSTAGRTTGTANDSSSRTGNDAALLTGNAPARKRTMSASARKRISAAQKARWAAAKNQPQI